MVLLLALVQLKEQEEILSVGMCMGAVGCKVNGKGMEEEGTDPASALAFPHGTKECTELGYRDAQLQVRRSESGPALLRAVPH